MRLTAPLALLVLLVATPAHAQPWSIEHGSLTLLFGTELLSVAERYDAEGVVVPFDERLANGPQAHYRSREFYLQGVHSLLEGLTLSLRLPLRQVEVATTTDGAIVEHEEVDLGDAVASLSMALGQRLGLPDPWEAGVELAIRLPLGYRRNVAPAVGSGQIDADLLSSIDRRLLGGNLRLHLETGYRFRSGIYALSRLVDCPAAETAGDGRCFQEVEPLSYGDQLLLGAGVDYVLLGRMRLSAFSDLEWSIRDPQPPRRRGGVLAPQWFTEERVAQAGAGITVQLFDELVISAAFQTPVYGRNAPRGTTLLLAVGVNL